MRRVLAQKEETFYTACWATDACGTPLLAVAGQHGVLRIIDCSSHSLLQACSPPSLHQARLRWHSIAALQGRLMMLLRFMKHVVCIYVCHSTFIGHGGSVNDLRVQLLQPSLLLSASKDESVRLWNAETGVCVLVFAGAGGHRNEVLSADFHPADQMKIASCGMDSTIKIWSYADFQQYIELSYSWTDSPSKFLTKHVQLPVFVAYHVHTNYVDCTRWLGDCILSKSVDNEVVLWRHVRATQDGRDEGFVDVLQRYAVQDCDVWFIKFSMDLACTTLAIGNREGTTHVWDPRRASTTAPARLKNAQLRSIIRQTAVSHDGRSSAIESI
eukprot:SM000024S07876  [mRNA]  locus=s24:894549:897728:- [translate_table: standard]